MKICWIFWFLSCSPNSTTKLCSYVSKKQYKDLNLYLEIFNYNQTRLKVESAAEILQQNRDLSGAITLNHEKHFKKLMNKSKNEFEKLTNHTAILGGWG